MGNLLKKINWENIKHFATKYSYLVSFLGLLLFATLINPRYFSYRNLSTLLLQASIKGIITLGMSMLIIAGMIDLVCRLDGCSGLRIRRGGVKSNWQCLDHARLLYDVWFTAWFGKRPACHQR